MFKILNWISIHPIQICVGEAIVIESKISNDNFLSYLNEIKDKNYWSREFI